MQLRPYMQSLAERAIMGKRASSNPSPAAAFLLGRRAVARGKAILRRRGKRSFFRSNPLPAVLGSIGGVLPGLGRKVDPKKQAERLARIRQKETAAIAGDKPSRAWLELIAAGREGAVAVNEQTVAEARAAMERVLAADEARAQKFLEQKQEASARGRAAAERERGFLEAGTTVASALASAVGRRGGRRPRRRRRRSF